MTEYTPDFVFAPRRTWTIADAARAASPHYMSMHFGKVRLSLSTTARIQACS